MADDKEINVVDEEIQDLSSADEDEEMPVAYGANDSDDSGSELNEESDDEMESNDGDEISENGTKKVCLPSRSITEDDELECDESAYIFRQEMKLGESCLSFDVIKDNLGDDRADNFPLTMNIVGGTQAEKRHLNNIIVAKMSNINKNKSVESDEDEDDDSEDEDSVPELSTALVRHNGCVNRIRYTSFGGKPLAASWSENKKVYLWDLTVPIRIADNGGSQNVSLSPLFDYCGHRDEGYAMDWSPHEPGALATGDNASEIHLWKPLNAGSWHVDQRTLSAHTASVEDLQWSPKENNILASCSADKSIRVWDTRDLSKKNSVITTHNAHDDDVNVIHWNRSEPFLLSGGDDGKIKVWDMRRFQRGSPLCTFKHHVAPITSVEWHPKDTTIFAASSEDHQLTLWDLSVEADVEQNPKDMTPEELEVPPQLLFIHQGQREVKEVHWHPQMPGVVISTAATGINVFRTFNI